MDKGVYDVYNGHCHKSPLCTNTLINKGIFMPKVFTSQSQRTGEIGENIAVLYLKRKGFSIVERNYTKKWGEIDIVAEKDGILHFIEVKAKTGKPATNSPNGTYRPEDGMHPWKIGRLKRTIQTYLAERCYEGEWRFGLITVYLNPANKTAQVQFLEDIIL